jgi:hypothetical protein
MYCVKLYGVHSVHYRQLIHTSKPTKYTKLFFRYLYYNIALNIPACFDLQETIIIESNQGNTAEHQVTYFRTQLTQCKRVR